MSQQVTFHLPGNPDERWTARAAHRLVGRAVTYGRMGKVGTVVRVVPVNVGRSLRVHVELSRKLLNPNRRNFAIADEEAS